MRVTLTDDARHDLELIYDYIAGDDLAAAVRVGQRIRGQVMAFTDHPKIGRVGRVEGTRELVIKDICKKNVIVSLGGRECDFEARRSFWRLGGGGR